MELVAKFYYDEKIFSNVALNCKHGSREIDTSFYGFKKSLFDKNLDYLILDPSELEWKENHSLEVFRFSRDSDKEVLKNILLTIVSSTEFPPYKVKCTDE
ncbi:MAG: hypothetical protein Q8Q04_03275, partial [archaeon]|nr:hypothetical protein [archaeon]